MFENSLTIRDVSRLLKRQQYIKPMHTTVLNEKRKVSNKLKGKK